MTTAEQVPARQDRRVADAPDDSAVSLSCQGLSFSFGRVPLLTGLNLEARRGEVLSVLGASGSGKTTFLRLLAGILPPGGGKIRVGNDDVTVAPPRSRRVGYVPQNYKLFSHLTVGGNVGYSLRMQGVKKVARAQRIGELLEAVGLAGFEDRRTHTLSGGQQQRVALARALAASPSVLLLDEPFAAVDQNLRIGLRREIRSLVKSLGITTVCVTHDVDEALDFSDRVALLVDGSIQQLDTPDRVYYNPATLAVARFLNSHNILAARLVSTSPDGGSTVELEAGFRLPLPTRSWPGATDRGYLVIRPEVLRLGGELGSAAVELPARVVDVHSLGTRDLVLVSLAPSGPRLRVELLRPHQDLVPGEDIMLQFRKEDAHVIPE